MPKFLKIVFPSFLFFLTTLTVNAQELFFNVIINSEQIQGVDKVLFTTMKQSITDFLNNRKWTNDNFKPEERIRGNLFISFTGSPAQGTFQATAQIQSSRPIYGASPYESILLNFLDKDFNFDYTQSQPMDFNENMYSSELTSLLAYYAYIVIGLDYDSFSKLGGTPYYEKARNILLAVQPASGGWTRDSPKNRYWLSQDLNHQQIIPLREGLYTYHRLAMDTFLSDPDAARVQILKVILSINNVNNTLPNTVIVKAFFTAKSSELISVFSKAAPDVKGPAVEVLKNIDAPNSEKYLNILKDN